MLVLVCLGWWVLVGVGDPHDSYNGPGGSKSN